MNFIMVKGIKIKIRHQVRFHIIDRLTQGLNKFVEIFLVEKYFVPVITIIIKAFAAFSNGEIIIITPGSSYIKEVGSSFSRTDAFTVNAFHFLVSTFVFLVIVLVRHVLRF